MSQKSILKKLGEPENGKRNKTQMKFKAITVRKRSMGKATKL
jgi:hypothetical protein